MADEHPFAQQQAAAQPPAPTPTPVSTPTDVPPSQIPGQGPVAPAPAESPFKASIKKARLRTIGLIAAGTAVVIGIIIYLIVLSGKGGILVEDTQVSQVTITLNGKSVKEVQQGDAVFIPAYAGQYRLQVVKKSYQPFVQDILLTKKETAHVRPAYALLPQQNQAGQGTTVDFVHPSLDQQYLYYVGNNRQTLYRMDIASRVSAAITTDNLQSLTDVEWSVKPDVALVQQNGSTYLQEIPSYDFVNQDLLKVGGSEILSTAWDPTNSNRIAAVYVPGTGEHSLVFADKQFTEIDRKADISKLTNPKLVWAPDASAVLLINRSDTASENNLYLYKTADGSLNQITTSGGVTDASFSPGADTILYSTSDSTLNLIKVDGSNHTTLGVKGKVSQAAWHNDSSFFLPEGSQSNLSLISTSGSEQDLSFTFSDTGDIQGMFYFSDSKTLIFYTDNAIYTVNVGL